MVEYQITSSVLVLSGFNTCPERIGVGGFLFIVFRGGCFLRITADQAQLSFLYLFYAFCVGTSRKRNMDEVENCSDVAVLSNWDVYLAGTTSSHHMVTHTKNRERILCCLRGMEAMGIFHFLLPGCIKPNLFLLFAVASGIGGTLSLSYSLSSYHSYLRIAECSCS